MEMENTGHPQLLKKKVVRFYEQIHSAWIVFLILDAADAILEVDMDADDAIVQADVVIHDHSYIEEPISDPEGKNVGLFSLCHLETQSGYNF